MAKTEVVFALIGKDLASKAFKDASKNADELGKKTDGLNKLGSAAGKVAAGGVLALGAAMVGGIKSAAEYEVLQKKTEAVIKSTGNTANISVKGVQGLAGSLENLSGVDEALIINSQNVLATFTKVRNEVGKGNDVFDQGTEAALNMSVALGTDLQSATMTIGKALNDPIKGVTALRRAGVQLTEQQTAQIKTMVESGDVMGAQKIILKELETQFGGAAKAAGNTFQGQLLRAQDAASDLAREFGQVVLPVLADVTEWVTNDGIPALKDFGGIVGSVISGTVDTFNDMPGAIQGGVVALGALAIAGRKVNDVGSKVNTAVTQPFRQLRYEMDFQRLVAQDVGKNITTMGAAMQVAKGKTSGLRTAVGGLKGAASGLVGVLGGPWGLAITAGAIALGIFGDQSAEAEARQQELADAGKSVAEAIKEQNGVINESVVQAAAKAAEDAGLLEGLNKLGVGYGTVTDAILGNGGALTDINRLLDAQSQKYAELAGGAVGEAQNQYIEQGDAVRALQDDLNALVGEKDRELAADKRVNQATKEGTTERGKETSAIDKQKQSLLELIDEKRKEAGVVLGSREAQRRYQESVDAASQALKDNGRTLDDSKEKGRANQSALDAMASAALEQAAAMRENGASQVTTAAKMKAAREEFVRIARQMGYSKSEAIKLADSLHLIPGDYIAKIKADTKDALKKAGFTKTEIQRILDSINDEGVKVKFTAAEIGGHPTTRNAAGNIYERHDAQIAPGGAWRLWAEPETGGEAYIPLAPSKRGRSMSILEDVASRFGVGLMPFADGAVIRMTGATSGINHANLSRIVQGLAQANAAKMLAAGWGSGPFSRGLIGALAAARSQVGDPYVWGGVGPSGFDCSGFMSYLVNVALGRSPYRRIGTTGTFPWSMFAPGTGAFTIGSSPAGGIGGSLVGHMAGTINGVNVESRGGDGVVVGPSARGANSGMFSTRAHLRGFANGGVIGDAPFDLIDPKGRYSRLRLASFDTGGYLMPGYTLAHNGTGRPERVGDPAAKVEFHGCTFVGSAPKQVEDLWVMGYEAAKRKHRFT